MNEAPVNSLSPGPVRGSWRLLTVCAQTGRQQGDAALGPDGPEHLKVSPPTRTWFAQLAGKEGPEPRLCYMYPAGSTPRLLPRSHSSIIDKQPTHSAGSYRHGMWPRILTQLKETKHRIVRALLNSRKEEFLSQAFLKVYSGSGILAGRVGTQISVCPSNVLARLCI